jgi:DNA-binding TFAR19-related protein (PDSD5 family)
MLYSHTEIKTNILNIKKMATKQELETAKAKAVKGGMPQDVADKVIQMAGSKGEFAMQMNKPKNYSADNFSSKDATMMMQSALYNPGNHNHPHTDTDPPGKSSGQNTYSSNLPNYDVTNQNSSTNPGSSSSNTITSTNYSGDNKQLTTEQAKWRDSEIKKLGGVQQYRDHYKIGKPTTTTTEVKNNGGKQISSSTNNISSSGKSESDIINDGSTILKNKLNRRKASREEKVRLAVKDSADYVNKNIKKLTSTGTELTNDKLTKLVNKGNQIGNFRLRSTGSGGIGGAQGFINGEQLNLEKFDNVGFSKQEADAMFNPEYGKNINVANKDFSYRAGVKGKKKKYGKAEGKRFSSSLDANQSSVDKKYGKGTVTNLGIQTNTGTKGSVGGYNSTEEYLSSMNMAPLKFYGKNKR